MTSLPLATLAIDDCVANTVDFLPLYTALKHLSLVYCVTAGALPRLDRLETLSVRSANLMIEPGKDAPNAAMRIITELSSASTRSLRLFEQYNPGSLSNPNSPGPNFNNLTRLELDAINFRTIRNLEDVFPSLTCRVVLRCGFNILAPALASHPHDSTLPLHANLEIWVLSDSPPVSPQDLSTPVGNHLQALVSVAPNLSALTLPLNLGIGRNLEDIVRVRKLIYAFLKQFVRTTVPVQFHRGSRNEHGSLFRPEFQSLDEFDGDGYFSDLVAGKVDDPEFRDFRVVVV